MAGKERQLSNKVYRNGHWIWTEVPKSKDKECTQFFWNKFNVSDFSSWFFLPDLSRAYDMVRVIEGKITANEIQEKSTLVRVSARLELSRVRVIGSQLYVQE